MEHVEAAFPDDPALQADMAATLTQTADALSDARASGMVDRAAMLLERAYGRDDRRTLAARQLVYHSDLLRGAGQIEQMERDLTLIRKLPASERDLLFPAAWLNCQRAHKARGTIDTFLPTLRDVRDQLSRESDADSGDKFSLDQQILLVETSTSDTARAIEGLRGMLDRASVLDQGEGAYTLSVLFELQQLQRTSGDRRGALQTLEWGAAICAELYGGMEQATHEWLSHLYRVALELHDYRRAVLAAREQVRAAEAMLGPQSLYTTKANGRLARALLALGENLEEAEKAARSAVEGAPELLGEGEGWALYHEAIWAWSIRSLGDPSRAEAVLRSRMEVETRAGRGTAANWVEIVQYTELAQCAMDQGEKARDMSSRVDAIESLLRVAERHAKELGPDWPSVQLVEAARARWESLRPR